MGSAKIEAVATCHMVALPYPGRGHINPMMNLCKLLASRSNHLLITFVVTEEWLGFIGSESKPANIRFATIPNVLPSELVRGADMIGFVQATQTKMEEPFEQLLDQLDPPVSIIMADTFLFWTINVGNQRNIPVASLWPMPASVFSIFYHFDLFVQNGHFPVDLSENGDEQVDYIPGISSIRLADLPTIIYKNQQLLTLALGAFPHVPKAQCLLFTSIFELEAPVINALKSKLPIPIYCFGPVIPYFNLGDNASQMTTHNNDTNYLKWLDLQPQCSVLYISLGSFLSVSSAQMDEIGAGLRASGVRYLWVARGEASRLKETCGDAAGMVVPWCDQLKVLCHRSIGGFWTHCGWSSTMESVFAGVPMLTFPLLMDQVPISKFIVEDWKIGWKVNGEVGMGGLVSREEIAELVQRFMDSENAEKKEMRRRARELKEISRQAIAKGGSSETNLDAFVKNILKCIHH
uniref:Putative UDP-glycosyltransferase 87A1-like n=1 Tax=Davidia involucrata TaxID=16924 RepID=A0A5B6YS72_DAVIN